MKIAIQVASVQAVLIQENGVLAMCLAETVVRSGDYVKQTALGTILSALEKESARPVSTSATAALVIVVIKTV